MKEISQIDDLESLKYVIYRELKSLGVKVPKEKRSSSQEPTSFNGVFGNKLGYVASIVVDHETGCTVPKFLVEAVTFLEKYLKSEGLFRKSGSHARQKDLKQKIQDGYCSIPADSQVYDIAGLFKQFFRELSDPLLTYRLHDAFMKCYLLEEEIDQQYAVLLLCNLLPVSHLHTLQYTMKFLMRVADHSKENKMDASNLAVVLAPNLMGSTEKNEKMTAAAEKSMRIRTNIIHQLIKDGDKIGTVSDILFSKISTMSTKSGAMSCDGLTSEDELDRSSDTFLSKKRRKKRRSGSVSGIVSGLGQSLGILKSANTSVNKTPGSVWDTPLTFVNSDTVSPHQSLLVPGETPTIRRSMKRKQEDIGAFSAAKRKAMLHQLTSDPKYSKQGIHIHKGTPVGLNTPITPLRPPGSAIGESSAKTSEQLFGFMSPSIKYADESGSFCSSPTVKLLDEINMSQDTITPSSKKKSKSKTPNLNKKIKRHSSSNAGSGCFSPRADNKRRSIRQRLRQRSSSVQGTPSKLKKNNSVGWRLAKGLPLDGLDTLNFEGLQNPITPIITLNANTKKSKKLFRRHKKVPTSPGRLITTEKCVSYVPYSPNVGSSQGSSAKEENQALLRPPSPSAKYRGKGTPQLGRKINENLSGSPKVITVDIHMKTPCNAAMASNRLYVETSGSTKSPGHVTAKPPKCHSSRQPCNRASSSEIRNLKPPSPVQLKKEQLAKQQATRIAAKMAKTNPTQAAHKQRIVKSASVPENLDSVPVTRLKPILKSSQSLPEELERTQSGLPPKMMSETQACKGRPILTAAVSLPEALVVSSESVTIGKSTSCQSIASILSEDGNDKESDRSSQSVDPPQATEIDVVAQKGRIIKETNISEIETVEAKEVTELARSPPPKMSKSESFDSGKGLSMFDLTTVGVQSTSEDGSCVEVNTEHQEVDGMTENVHDGSGVDVDRNSSISSVDSVIDSAVGCQDDEMEIGDNACSEVREMLHEDDDVDESCDSVSTKQYLSLDSFDEQNCEGDFDSGTGNSSISKSKIAHSSSDSKITVGKVASEMVKNDGNVSPLKRALSYTLPNRDETRQESTSSLNSSLVQRHIELFNSFNKEEFTSPLRVAKKPLAFRRAPSLRRRKNSDSRDDSESQVVEVKSMKKTTSDVSLMKRPKIPITSMLVKSMSMDSGFTKLACDTSYIRKESHDHNDSYEEAISSAMSHVRVPRKVIDDDDDDVFIVPKSPLKDYNFIQSKRMTSKKEKSRKMTPMRELPKKYMIAPQSLTPLKLATRTRVRSNSGKVVKKSPMKALKRLSPESSGHFKHNNALLTPTNRTSKILKKSPKYPNSPKSPVKMTNGGGHLKTYYMKDF
ncbi:uncharacterized protein LOC100370086 [Saccoglossus kowalevskii]|uniref:Uncharacterized protein LOC100370086 n=1 Tax=Saccoglossus kowalevskii TaxID=10224 RepID=A0ABM0GZH4_SACKO|nr:PREDICTED: uncharacterized protein LOC100370086 [Saccoglossus kowalevskii]